jgi:hypothetical protein
LVESRETCKSALLVSKEGKVFPAAIHRRSRGFADVLDVPAAVREVGGIEEDFCPKASGSWWERVDCVCAADEEAEPQNNERMHESE